MSLLLTKKVYILLRQTFISCSTCMVKVRVHDIIVMERGEAGRERGRKVGKEVTWLW